MEIGKIKRFPWWVHLVVIAFTIFIITGACNVYGNIKTPFTTTPPTPTLPVTTTVKPEMVAEVCIYRMPEIEQYWPVDAAIWEWNKNNKNMLVEGRLAKNCLGTVVLSESSGVEWWGRTHFLDNGVIALYFNTEVPEQFRQSVVCHELGHVLGLPHTSDLSCMAKGSTHPVPTVNEITTAGKNLWIPSLAARQAQGE